jgi:hypothetical protein
MAPTTLGEWEGILRENKKRKCDKTADVACC